MGNMVSDNLILQAARFISDRLGLQFPENRLQDLERGLTAASAELGFDDTGKFIEWLISYPLTRQNIETIASHLTVGETYFFRDRKGFEFLEEKVFSELVSARRSSEKRLRVWTAGCSTGEEPYSVAILLNKIIPDINSWNVTILATDINTSALKKAKMGTYTEWSFRNTPMWVKERNFRKADNGNYEIMPHIKRMVSFEYLNLADDIYPSLLNNTNAMDLIFCRNVLMYFSPEQAKNTINRLYNSLIDGGWFLTGPTDYVRSLPEKLVTVNIPDMAIYRKDPQDKQAAKQVILNKAPYPPLPVASEGVRHHINHSFISAVKTLKKDPLPSANNTGMERRTGQTGDMSSEAMTLFEQGCYREAAEMLSALHSVNRNDSKVTSLLARACANQGRLDDALKWCETTISLDRINSGHYYLLATVLMEQGRTDEAVSALKKAVYLDHDFVLAYFMLGNVLMKQGEEKAARKYFANALDLLGRYSPEETPPESDGVTAGRLKEIIRSMLN